MHQANCTAVLYKRTSSFSSKQHTTLEEETKVKKNPKLVEMSSKPTWAAQLPLEKGTSCGSGFCANSFQDEVLFDVYLFLLGETQKRCFREYIRQGTGQHAQSNRNSLFSGFMGILSKESFWSWHLKTL